MKNIVVLATIFLLSFMGQCVQAQAVIRQAPCNDPSIRHQADSIKQQLALAGFIDC